MVANVGAVNDGSGVRSPREHAAAPAHPAHERPRGVRRAAALLLARAPARRTPGGSSPTPHAACRTPSERNPARSPRSAPTAGSRSRTSAGRRAAVSRAEVEAARQRLAAGASGAEAEGRGHGSSRAGGRARSGAGIAAWAKIDRAACRVKERRVARSALKKLEFEGSESKSARDGVMRPDISRAIRQLDEHCRERGIHVLTL